MTKDSSIPVTKTFFPDQQTYHSYLNRIWGNGWLTNHGELSKELEGRLIDYLDLKNIVLTNNGTMPLQIALKSLVEKGEIITSPFSYIATSAAIVWEGYSPVFVDIDPTHLTIDESKIEEAITPKTKAILATHVFGNPCNIKVIEEIASKYNIVVIYDAAHCFGVKYNGESLFNFGDVSTCSFHATKIFHTAEGGAIFFKNPALKNKLKYAGNFGHKGKYDYHGLGINAKMSELQAAMGLSVLPAMNDILHARKSIVELYRTHLTAERISFMTIRENTTWNYSYFPIIFENETITEKVIQSLEEKKISPRRYFYPSLNTIDYLKGQDMPISESISSRILCLPLYIGLSPDEVTKISNIVIQSVNREKTISV